MRKLLSNSYLQQKANDWVRSEINFLVGPQEHLVTVKRRKLAWFGTPVAAKCTLQKYTYRCKVHVAKVHLSLQSAFLQLQIYLAQQTSTFEREHFCICSAQSLAATARDRDVNNSRQIF